MSRASSRKAALGSFVGTALEWYDFFLYGTASALILPRVFFPSFDPGIGMLLSFATFGVAFVARPVGGIIFGHLGDRIGRKPTLILTLLLMGVVTGLIGVLPSYDMVGSIAPILLVAFRFFQGIAVGGEYGGAVLMSIEHSEKGRRGFYSSWVQMGSPAGFILSNSAILAVVQLPDDQLFSWGWRIPFLLSFLLVLVGLYIRLNVEESPEFVAVQKSGVVEKSPLLTVIRKNYRQILLLTGAYLGTGIIIYVATVYALSYGLTTLGFTRGEMVTFVLLGQCVSLIAMPLFATLSDKYGFARIYILGNVGMAITVFPWLWLIGTGDWWLALVGFILLFIPYAAAYGSMGAFFGTVFESRVNYSGLSLSYQLGSVVGPAFAPLIAAQLFAITGTINTVGAYLVISCLVSIVCAKFVGAPRAQSIASHAEASDLVVSVSLEK